MSKHDCLAKLRQFYKGSSSYSWRTNRSYSWVHKLLAPRGMNQQMTIPFSSEVKKERFLIIVLFFTTLIFNSLFDQPIFRCSFLICLKWTRQLNGSLTPGFSEKSSRCCLELPLFCADAVSVFSFLGVMCGFPSDLKPTAVLLIPAVWYTDTLNKGRNRHNQYSKYQYFCIDRHPTTELDILISTSVTSIKPGWRCRCLACHIKWLLFSWH